MQCNKIYLKQFYKLTIIYYYLNYFNAFVITEKTVTSQHLVNTTKS